MKVGFVSIVQPVLSALRTQSVRKLHLFNNLSLNTTEQYTNSNHGKEDKTTIEKYIYIYYD